MKYRSPHEIAARKVRSKKRFYRHFAVFLASMFLMFSINIFNYSWHVGLWAIYPLVTWGSMILLQYLLVFGFPITGALSEEWEIEEMRKELYKVGRAHYDNGDYMDLSREEQLELRELDRLKNKWETDDYV